MVYASEIRLAPSVSSMSAFIEPHRQWIECVLGCAASDSITFELELPFGHFAADETLKGVPLDRQCLFGADEVRPMAVRWETPPGISPRIELIHSREAGSLVTERKRGWDPHWRETPIAVWLKGLNHALVAATVPYVSFSERRADRWQDLLMSRQCNYGERFRQGIGQRLQLAARDRTFLSCSGAANRLGQSRIADCVLEVR